MHKIGAQDGEWKAYGLVRDKDGKPRIDDPDTLPQEVRDMLTDDEYFEIYQEARK